MSEATTSTTTETTKATKNRVDPYLPYWGLVLDAFKHNVNQLLGAQQYPSRTALHAAYVSTVGDISAGTFAEWLEQAGFKFNRTVSITSN